MNIQNILLVDDSPNDVTLIKAALKKAHMGNSVIVAENGEEALDFLYKRGKFADYDGTAPIFILLDIKMPVLNGIETLKLIRGDSDLNKIPVIMLTGSNNPDEIKESYLHGANSYVVKPIHVSDFMQMVYEIGKYWVIVNQKP